MTDQSAESVRARAIAAAKLAMESPIGGSAYNRDWVNARRIIEAIERAGLIIVDPAHIESLEWVES